MLRANYVQGDLDDAVTRMEVLARAQVPSIKPPVAPEAKTEPAMSVLSTHETEKFNYDAYMRKLSENVSRTSTGASSGPGLPVTGSDFQAYLLREREQFHKSVNELRNE